MGVGVDEPVKALQLRLKLVFGQNIVVVLYFESELVFLVIPARGQ